MRRYGAVLIQIPDLVVGQHPAPDANLGDTAEEVALAVHRAQPQRGIPSHWHDWVRAVVAWSYTRMADAIARLARPVDIAVLELAVLEQVRAAGIGHAYDVNPLQGVHADGLLHVATGSAMA